MIVRLDKQWCNLDKVDPKKKLNECDLIRQAVVAEQFIEPFIKEHDGARFRADSQLFLTIKDNKMGELCSLESADGIIEAYTSLAKILANYHKRIVVEIHYNQWPYRGRFTLADRFYRVISLSEIYDEDFTPYGFYGRF